ncbi:MAG TPA: hypothetical protein VFN56_05285 [Candidatus Saccharimonadales bacterium]|nr:hypothetical protein [Candidatus Saccharimonadales bacterium]
MAAFADDRQELVVGLFDRGADVPPERRIFDIGTWKPLRSGIWTPYVVNFRPALSIDTHSTLPVQRQRLFKSLLLEAIGDELDMLTSDDGITVDHIFGPPQAGTALASAVSGISGHSLLWQRLQEEGNPKTYGNHCELEGIYHPSQNVVEVDDVITTGGAKKAGRDFLAAYGLSVPAVVIGFDREQGGREGIESDGLHLRAALGATATFAYLRDARRITKTEHDYLVEYTQSPAPLSKPADHPWKHANRY